MQGVEPATGLIHAFADKVCREILIENVLVLKGIVPLRIRHGAAVKPYVYQVGLTMHGLAAGAHQDDLVYIRFMQVQDTFMQVMFVHVSAQYFIGLADLGVQLSYAAYAYLSLAIFCTPNRQWGTPVTATAQVPVYHVLQPVAETAGTCSGRLPVDGLVQFHHPVFQGSGFDEPGIQRVVQHGFVCTPAVRVAVLIFFYFKGAVLFFQLHSDINIHVFIVFLVFIVLYITAAELAYAVQELALPVYQGQDADAVFLAYAVIVCTKGGSGVYDTGTIFCGDEVAQQYAEASSFLVLHV